MSHHRTHSGLPQCALCIYDVLSWLVLAASKLSRLPVKETLNLWFCERGRRFSSCSSAQMCNPELTLK
jgi:hypothetical protein